MQKNQAQELNPHKSMTKLSKNEKEDMHQKKREKNRCVPPKEMTGTAHSLVLPFPMSKSCLVL